MRPDAARRRPRSLAGLWVAGVGFFVILFTVSLPSAYAHRPGPRLAVDVGWSVVLWLVAFGVVVPAWLNLAGVPAMVLSPTPSELGAHLAWGVTLAMTYHAGERWLATGRAAGAGP